MNLEKLAHGIQYLAEHGLNLYAVFDCAALPPDIRRMMDAAEIPLDNYARLVLLGHAGRRFWTALQAYGMRTPDPVDHFSLALTQTFIADYLDAPSTLAIYPTIYAVPLQRLGTLAGWSHPSPLGLGISPIYGVWFAYRAAFLTPLEIPLTDPQTGPSPCDTCPAKPCITACPAGAVRGIDAFDLPACTGFRLSESSACTDRCLSRLACPYFPEHRYTLEQVQYHYRRSLETIRLYQRGEI